MINCFRSTDGELFTKVFRNLHFRKQLKLCQQKLSGYKTIPRLTPASSKRALSDHIDDHYHVNVVRLRSLKCGHQTGLLLNPR
jgi:hypothetical protein